MRATKKKTAVRSGNIPARNIARRRRRNPDDEQTAAELSEKFHGRPAHSVRTVEETELERAELADLGRLKELHVLVEGDRFRIPFYATNTRLGASPNGCNLYLVGGRQAFDLATIGIESDKDQVPLGECCGIVYHTRKAFHNFESENYEHEFGEETGERPILCYSQLNEKFYLEGGAYEVKPEGIVN